MQHTQQAIVLPQDCSTNQAVQSNVQNQFVLTPCTWNDGHAVQVHLRLCIFVSGLLLQAAACLPTLYRKTFLLDIHCCLARTLMLAAIQNTHPA